MIVVDRPIHWGRVFNLRHGPSAHLLSDLPGPEGSRELSAFAARLGLRPALLHHAGTFKEHYDLAGPLLDAARRAGAVEISRTRLVEILRAKRSAARVDTVPSPGARVQPMETIHPGKAAAARAAAALVLDGMVVGLGTGSTAVLFVKALAERVRDGLRVVGVPTSEATATLARAEGIPLASLETHPRVDLDVDGADGVDPELQLVKGLGGALLREKLVAAASARFAVIVDEGKLLASLADCPVVPVEVVAFGWSSTRARIEALGAEARLRERPGAPGTPFVTDGGNHILDCRFGAYPSARTLAERLKSLTGVVDHGFFIDLATEVLAGAADGSVRRLAR